MLLRVESDTYFISGFTSVLISVFTRLLPHQFSMDASTISRLSEGSGSSHTESPIPATPNSEEAIGAEVSEQPTKAKTHVEKSPEKSKRDTEHVLVKRMAAALTRLGRLTLWAMLRLVKCLILAMLGLVPILWLVIKNGIVLRVIAFCELVGDCAYFPRKCSVPTLKGIPFMPVSKRLEYGHTVKVMLSALLVVGCIGLGIEVLHTVLKAVLVVPPSR